MPASGQFAEPGATEALLADPRNDVSVLLSQTTVLFHLLHNHAESKLAMDDEKAGRNGGRQCEIRFAKARKVAAFVFRQIIENDLMPRLLSRACHKRLRGSMSTGRFQDDVHDERVPLEFSHTAYRIETIEFVQSALEHLVLRLPPPEMAREGLDRVETLGQNGHYLEPNLYKERILGGDVGNLECFFSRIGDYTIAQCR